MQKRIQIVSVSIVFIILLIGIIVMNNNSNSKYSFTQDGIKYALTLDGEKVTSFPSKGMYKAQDDLGTSYYFRGAVDNNWVKYGKYTKDAYIVMSKGQNKSVSFEIEGTNSAGDLGAAASISFQHRNVFKGSETFTMKVRGAMRQSPDWDKIMSMTTIRNMVWKAVLTSLNLCFPFFLRTLKGKLKLPLKWD